MNIGAGLAALDEYYKEGDRRQVRDYNQRIREADLSILDDRTAATRSGYRDTQEVNAARARLRPGETANALTALGLKTADLAGEAERKSDEIATKNIQARIALDTTQNAHTNLPISLAIQNNTLQGQLETSKAHLANLPGKLQQAALQGVLDQQGQRDVVVGTLGQLLARGDKASALRFSNEVAKQSNVLPNTNGLTFTNIVEGRGGLYGEGYSFVTADGQSKFVPAQAIAGAMQKLKSGKYKFIERGDGSIFAGDESTGRGSLVQDGDPALAARKNSANTPASVQEAEWVMRNKDNPEAMKAWETVRASRGGRKEFVQALMAKGVMGNETQAELASKANMYGSLFDEITKAKGGGAPQPGQLGSGTWNQWLE
jgi:hypothetical protein